MNLFGSKALFAKMMFLMISIHVLYKDKCQTNTFFKHLNEFNIKLVNLSFKKT